MMKTSMSLENMSLEMQQSAANPPCKDQIFSRDAFNFLFFVEAMNPPSNVFTDDWNNTQLNYKSMNGAEPARHKVLNETARSYNCASFAPRHNNFLDDKGHQFNKTQVENTPFKMLSMNPFQHIMSNESDRNMSGKASDFHTDDRNFVCNICGKNFKRRSSLSTHKLIHDNVKPFSCLTCRKTFLRRSDLKKHILMHTGQKPHQCSECGRVFSQSSNMLTHMRRHSGVRPYSCQICGNSFYRKVDVRRHQVKHLKDDETLSSNQHA